MALSELQKRALSLYRGPFRYEAGYIWDSKSEMVADMRDDDHNNVVALRVRGWGRISYLPDPEKLQDTIGELMAAALTEFWTRQEDQ